jgi:glutathione S-transferase
MRLFELPPTRSDRVKWTALETDTIYKSVTAATGAELFSNPELKKFHPLSRVPALDVDGQGLFESAAISTYLADQMPEKGLISASGTWERALHDQWVCFALTEMEAWLWSTFRSENILPTNKRVPEMYEHNKEAYRISAAALDDKLGEQDYLIGNKFSVTDIIVSWTCQFGKNLEYNDGFDNISAYLARVKERPHCTLKK